MDVKHFELWGYPGAGKTTVWSHLRNVWRAIEAPQPGIRASGRADYLLETALSVFGDGILGGHIRRTKRRRERMADILAVAAAQARIAAEHEPPYVLEEGITHEIWRAIYSDPSLIKTGWWKQHIHGNAAQVIVLNVSPHCAQSRIQTKAVLGSINMELRNAPLDGEMWGRARAAYKAISNELELSAQPAIRLDANRGGAADISARVSSIISGAGGRIFATGSHSSAD